jgi:hypothetical protein
VEEVRMSETPDSENAAREAGADDVLDDDDNAAPPAAPETAVAEPSSPEVARAVAELDNLGGLDLGDHPDAYQRIHVELQNALASIDDA